MIIERHSSVSLFSTLGWRKKTPRGLIELVYRTLRICQRLLGRKMCSATTLQSQYHHRHRKTLPESHLFFWIRTRNQQMKRMSLCVLIIPCSHIYLVGSFEFQWMRNFVSWLLLRFAAIHTCRLSKVPKKLKGEASVSSSSGFFFAWRSSNGISRCMRLGSQTLNGRLLSHNARHYIWLGLQHIYRDCISISVCSNGWYCTLRGFSVVLVLNETTMDYRV